MLWIDSQLSCNPFGFRKGNRQAVVSLSIWLSRDWKSDNTLEVFFSTFPRHSTVLTLWHCLTVKLTFLIMRLNALWTVLQSQLISRVVTSQLTGVHSFSDGSERRVYLWTGRHGAVAAAHLGARAPLWTDKSWRGKRPVSCHTFAHTWVDDQAASSNYSLVEWPG